MADKLIEHARVVKWRWTGAIRTVVHPSPPLAAKVEILGNKHPIISGPKESKVVSNYDTQGWLKNGNPQGDFRKAPRCGVKTRAGTGCQCPAMPNGRCRLHGGLSTGPKTAEGIERIRLAVTKHGRYTKQSKTKRAEDRKRLRAFREMLARLSSTGRLNDSASASALLRVRPLRSLYRFRTHSRLTG